MSLHCSRAENDRNSGAILMADGKRSSEEKKKRDGERNPSYFQQIPFLLRHVFHAGLFVIVAISPLLDPQGYSRTSIFSKIREAENSDRVMG